MAVSDADRKVASQLMEQARREAAAAKGTSTPMSMLRKAARPATEDTMPVFSARKREQQQETIAVVPSTISRPRTKPLNEKKHAAFVRLAEPRMTNLIHYFRANILVLAAVERYDYTPEEAEAMIGAVEQMGRELRHAFQQRGKRKLRGEFSF